MPGARSLSGHSTVWPTPASAIATGRPSSAAAAAAMLSRFSPATAAETIVSGVVRGAAEAAPRESPDTTLLSACREERMAASFARRMMSRAANHATVGVVASLVNPGMPLG